MVDQNHDAPPSPRGGMPDAFAARAAPPEYCRHVECIRALARPGKRV
jgi:hypothetical protein